MFFSNYILQVTANPEIQSYFEIGLTSHHKSRKSTKTKTESLLAIFHQSRKCVHINPENTRKVSNP